MATGSVLMTEEEFLALPDDEGVERELIRGVLRESSTMTTRGFAPSVVLNRVAFRLTEWVKRQPGRQGIVVVGEARIRLRADVSTFVGVDLAYFAPGSRPENPRKARFVAGPPILAVEILSPSDTTEAIEDKVFEYLDAGVPIVWTVSTSFSTVTAHRPDAKPQLFNTDHEITAEPHLPGFRLAVADLFEDLEG